MRPSHRPTPPSWPQPVNGPGFPRARVRQGELAPYCSVNQGHQVGSVAASWRASRAPASTVPVSSLSTSRVWNVDQRDARGLCSGSAASPSNGS